MRETREAMHKEEFSKIILLVFRSIKSLVDPEE